jgi:methylglutaconyl-CoA hydratase
MSLVRIEDDGAVRTLTLNRAEKKNALTPEMQEELIAALESVAPETRVIVLCGEGGAFCSGLDLGVLLAMRDASAEQLRADAARTARMFRALAMCDVPVIAVVDGVAVAGGAGLATIADFTLLSTDAKIGYTEARIGFVPALVSAYLRLQVGEKVARSLLLSARLIDAAEALRLGLATEICVDVQARARELAAELMRNSPESLRATKRLLRAQHAEWLDGALAAAAEANAVSRETTAFREGIAAFAEKRKPKWSQP